MTQEFVTVIFDANGGGITVSSKRTVRNQPYGELPVPSRFGYEFDGWFTADEGGERVDAETPVTADSSHALYAHWTKNVQSDAKLQAYRKKKPTLKRQKALLFSSVALALTLIAGLFVVMYFVNRTSLKDVDDTVYKIIRKNGVYVLCDQNEKLMPMTEDGKYYTTAAGSQIKLDASSGNASIYAYVDVAGREVLGNLVLARILAFPQIERSNIASIEVHNSSGSYTIGEVYRDNDGDGVKERGFCIKNIKGHEYTELNPEKLASLIVSCGYVLAIDKIDPVRNEDGSVRYSEYGLAGGTRDDEHGEPYEYSPAWYKLTDTNGNEYEVRVGDATVSGTKYYVQYINPDDPETPYIYTVSPDIQNTVLRSVEALVTPRITYPSSLSTYFDVRRFSIKRANSDVVVSFSFVPLNQRLGTQLASVPYIFHNEEFKVFKASSDNIDAALQSFATMKISEVIKLAPGDREMFEYGLADPECIIYFDFVVSTTQGKDTVPTWLYISKMTEDGNYYVYSELYGMIVKIDRQYMPYVEWEPLDWLDKNAYNINLACTNDITLIKDGEKIFFDIDNSDSPQYNLSALTKNSYTRDDGDKTKTTYHLVKRDGKYAVASGSENGEEPAVFARNVKYRLTEDGKLNLIRDTTTTALDLNDGKMGTCTLYVTGYDKDLDAVLYIFVDRDTGVWGKVVRNLSSADTRATGKLNSETAKNLVISYFRRYFQVILYASIEGECPLSEQEMAALRAKPDSEADLMMIINTEEGPYTFRFYRYTNQRSYVTINGVGTLYVLNTRVDKLFNDALKILNGEDVNPIGKY